jgi:transposase
MSYEASNIGIDDFSLKKREKYATIIVDNDKRKRVEAINSREQAGVTAVLRKFKKIKTVTRDFSITYKKAIEESHPKAKHIVDRFHIFKNLTEDLVEYMKRTIKDRIKIVSIGVELNDTKVLNAEQRAKVGTAARKWELAHEVKRLKSEGKNNCEISRSMKICRPTVIKYLKMAQMPILPDNSIVDRYVPLIKELIISGRKTDEIYRAIKSAGYPGKQSLLYSRLKGIRQEIKENTKYLNRSQLKKVLYKPIEEIKDCELRGMIEKYLETNLELKKVTDIARKFKEIIFSGKPQKLDSWLKKADSLAVVELSKFTNLIRSDIKAVKNAVIYQQYSNGLTEGFNNKTKVIKRIMYGRCGFELLRLKILAFN